MQKYTYDRMVTSLIYKYQKIDKDIEVDIS